MTKKQQKPIKLILNVWFNNFFDEFFNVIQIFSAKNDDENQTI